LQPFDGAGQSQRRPPLEFREVLLLTATVTATRGEQPWTVANDYKSSHKYPGGLPTRLGSQLQEDGAYLWDSFYELSVIMNSASMDAGGRWWT
jgi:hypothetical protein